MNADIMRQSLLVALVALSQAVNPTPDGTDSTSRIEMVAPQQSFVLYGEQVDVRYLDGPAQVLATTRRPGILVLDELWGTQAPGTSPPDLAASAWEYVVNTKGLDPSRVVLRRVRIRGMRQSALRVTIQWRGQPPPLLEGS